MTSADILALGGPTAGGIPLPEDPRECSLRNFQATYDGASNSVSGAWELIQGDEGFQVFQGDRQIGGDLGAGENTFTDTTPPVGEISAIYILKPLVGGAVERECSSGPVQTFVCPTNMRCKTDQNTPAVTLTWDPEVNVVIQGYRVARDGIPVKTIAPGTTTYTDSAIPGPGIYRYELTTLLAGGGTVCPIGCTANVTGVDIDVSTDDGATWENAFRRVAPGRTADPVGLLNHLFGAAAPPAPPGLEDCGPDPDEPGAPGDLGCETYTSC